MNDVNATPSSPLSPDIENECVEPAVIYIINSCIMQWVSEFLENHMLATWCLGENKF